VGAGVAGCGAAPPPRVPRELFSSQELLFSNSPILEGPHAPRVQGERVSVMYSFLVENAGRERQALQLSGAFATIRVRRSNVSCFVEGGSLNVLTLLPTEICRVDCEISFTWREVPLAAFGDVTANLVIPIEHADATREVAFDYFFRTGDAP
jgi:hypothetical protein